MFLLEWLFSIWFNFYQKNNQTDFFKKKTETGSNRPVSVSVRLGFLEQKPVQTNRFRFGSAFQVRLSFFGLGLVQFGLAQFFSGLARFFRFGFGSVRFFLFQAYKTKTKLVGFLKILINFFLQFNILSFFSRFNQFFSFFLTSNFHIISLKLDKLGFLPQIMVLLHS